MTSVDGLLRSLELARSSIAVEIAKALVPGGDDERRPAPPRAGYAAPTPPSRPIAQTLAGLRLPVAGFDHMDVETSQSLLRNATANPAMVQASLANAIAASLKQAPTPLPGDAASQQGFAAEDAAQLLTTSAPPDRLRGDAMPPFRQMLASGPRAELWDGRHPAPSAPARPQAEQPREATARGESNADLPVRQNDHAGRTRDASGLAQAMMSGGAPQAERTAIVPSHILNAAMIPGWPFQGNASAAALAAGTRVSEEEALACLARLGADDALVKKLRQARPPAGKKLLIYLATLLAAVETAVETITAELAMLCGDEQNVEESRAGANSRGHAGGRRHLYVE